MLVMDTVSSPLIPSPFDADAFGVDYYRVVGGRPNVIADALKILPPGPRIVDAKARADETEFAAALLALGFRRICTQVELHRQIEPQDVETSAVAVHDRIELSADHIAMHAENFVYDRFSLDPLLPRAGHDRLYRKWIANSATAGFRKVVHIGPNICTFRREEQDLVIDLLSVLETGCGIAKRLLAGVAAYGSTTGASAIRVVTECENRPAWRLYLGRKFTPVEFTTVFHSVIL
jgi:ribosomal protein S18 acetylase RimI-like enzyme